jgi:ectoine hydroxylase
MEADMKLTEKNLEEYRNRGFLFFESLLSKEEADSLQREIPGIVAQKRREIVNETDKKTARSIFNLHAYNEKYARLVRHPRLVEPSMQLVGGLVYVSRSSSTTRRL